MHYFRFNNTKIANSIKRNEGLPGFRLVISVNQRGAKYDIRTRFVLTEDLSFFDMAVADAIYSLHLEGEKKFTPRKVLAILSGDPAISVPGQRKQQIEACIEKLMHTEIHISCPEEAKQSDALLPRYGGAFLQVSQTGNGYQFLSDSPLPLYTYGEAKRQIITVPSFLLAYTPLPGREKEDRLVSSRENILLKQALLHELELVRNTKNHVPEKTFSFRGKTSPSLLPALEIDPDTFTEEACGNKTRELYRKAVLLFDYWQRSGYLKTYDADKKEYRLHVSQDMLCSNPSTLKYNASP